MPKDDATGLSRVLILGGPGSGKTTLARALGSRLPMPHHELDRVAYDPPDGKPDAPFWQWARVPDGVRQERAIALAASGRWVADGLYAGWTAPLRDAADIIIWLDLPPRVTTWRVIKRAVAHRWRGGRDWDIRSVLRVARGTRSYSTRPAATVKQLRERDSANGAHTLEAFLRPATHRVARCRNARQVRQTLAELLSLALEI
ncbi:hypothetical protein [Krasilnikovia sp. MM14-A1259]|uniref:hypothetical protein n=1 Tax=Krasilnikovia sp. MM14-A1259 TaxID=3373539 RepID=UPI00399D03FC